MSQYKMKSWSDITKPVFKAGNVRSKWTTDVVYWRLVYNFNWRPLPDWQHVNPQNPIPGQCMICLWVNHSGPTWNSLINQGTNACNNCAGKRRKTDDEVRAICEAAGCTPHEPLNYKGKDAPIPSTCHACGNDCSPTYGSLRCGQGPCTCVWRGFYNIKDWKFYSIDGGSYDVDNSGLYIVEFWMNGQRILKRGIDGSPGGCRVKEHANRGANILYYERMNLKRAIFLEQRMLEVLIGPDNWKPLRDLNGDPDYPLRDGGNECFEPSGATIALWSHSQNRYVDVTV